MVKVSIKNAQVEDNGYGIRVAGKDLEDIISNALGVKAGDHSSYNDNLPDFRCNSCDITLIIDPHPTECVVETDTEKFNSIKELWEARENEYKEKATEDDTEE